MELDTGHTLAPPEWARQAYAGFVMEPKMEVAILSEFTDRGRGRFLSRRDRPMYILKRRKQRQ